MTLSGYLDVPRREIFLPSGKLPPRGLVGATHTISLQSLSAQGVVLLGRFMGIENDSLIFADNLDEHMSFADESSADVKRFIDDYIRRARLNVPPAEDDPAEVIAPRLPSPPSHSIELATSGIRSVIWCTGFRGDFRWIKIPDTIDDDGQPIHQDGTGFVPGLYFSGRDFASTRKSGTSFRRRREVQRSFIDCGISMGDCPLLASRHERRKSRCGRTVARRHPSVVGGGARHGRLGGTYASAITASISTCAPFGSALTS
ncbi:hypothetical protein [Sinorhizobium fredii]|uniref:hypothetical protein n=1 Tax=Rhizobium fredii TaxID=380 RepID=UPI002958BFFC|nr:hypothetical protein [Sinorhizobium fredii]WOS66878.1 hypothetical protein SFGR64A_29115 [Sinorhizobium fredii GR64]